MTRYAFSLIVAALLTVTVGAQGLKTLLPQQKSELFKKNRLVIEKIVEKTVESARTPNDHVRQADSYYDILVKFNAEIGRAREAKDTARVDELTHHLETLLDGGLTPTLEEAKIQVENGTHAGKYVEVKAHLMTQLDALRAILDEGTAARKSLDGAKDRLQRIDAKKP